MNKDTFVERVVGILSSRLEEGLVKAQNKAAKKAWEAEQGKKKSVTNTGVTPREIQAAQKGGRGGGAEAMRRGVQASYRAAHRQDASTDPKVNFINRTVDNLVERLIGKQKKLDVNKSGKLDAQDFKMLRKGKRKDEALDPQARGAMMMRVAKGKLTGSPASTRQNIDNDAEFYGKAMADKRKERLAKVDRKDEAKDNIIEGLVKAANKMAKRAFMQKKGEDSSTATYGTAKDKPGDVDVRRARRDNKLDAKDPDDVAHTAKSNRMRKVRGY